MNIIVITTCNRPELYAQTMHSLTSNAAEKHPVTVVFNGVDDGGLYTKSHDALIVLGNVGASRSRNVGASSIPKYLREDYVCFFDDDIFCTKGWDAKLEAALRNPMCAVSGHGHPYNHTILGPCRGGAITTVLSTVNIACSWTMWDDVGWFLEPGGPAGSEDVEWCARASAKGYGLVVTDPQVILHTGITSSSGKPIVGQKEVMENNRRLEEIHGITGKVKYA